MNYLCIDVGGTSIKYGVAVQNGTLLLKGEMPNVIEDKGVKQFTDRVAYITELLGQEYHFQGIGVSATGVVDPDRGIVLDYSGFFPPDTPLRDLLEQGCGLPCTVENDVNAAALGEYWLGAGQGAKSLYCVTLGTGIGGSAIIGGHLIHGAAFCGGEVGNLYVGLKNVWEKEVPTSVLIRNVAAIKGLPESQLDGKKIFAMAQAGDADAKAAIAKQMDILAAGIANICYVLNPERIIVGGGISAQSDYLYPLLDAALRKRLIPPVYESTTLCFAALKNDAGMIGALYNFLLRNS